VQSAAMTTTQVAENFLGTQLFFTKEGEEATFEHLGVPGIGPAGCKNLVDGNENFDGGVTNAAQVMGYFLRLNGDTDAMKALLVDKCGCHKPSVEKAESGTLAALQAKCEGFISAEASESAESAETPPEGTTKVMAAFQSKQLSWADTFDSNPVPGLGEVGRAKLSESGIGNAVQLIGLFMTYNGDPEAFTEDLLERGLRRQEIEKDNGILQALTEKMSAFCASA